MSTTVTTSSTFDIGPHDTLTLNSSAARGTLTLTSAAPKLLGNQTLGMQSGTFGPWGVPMTVSITVSAGALDYTVNSYSLTPAQVTATQAFVYSGTTPSTTFSTAQVGATALDSSFWNFSRTSNYAGGTPGWVNSCVHVQSNVNNASTTSYEWTLTSVMNNYASGGENVAGYFQGNKYGTGPTWGAVAEVIERTAVNDPTTGTVGLEVDIGCSGTDTYASLGSRVGVDLVVRKTAGATDPAHVSWGFRIQNGGSADSVVGRGFSFSPGMIVEKAFDASTATVLTAAFQMQTNQVFSFNSSGTRQMTHNGTSWVLKNNTGTTYWGFADSGALSVQGVQLLGARDVGWTTGTGTLTSAKSAFNADTATTQQIAQRLTALEHALFAHGLIGT